MPKNVEIKASVPDLPRLLKLAQDLSLKDATVLVQKDIFYKCHNGRLKLRSVKSVEKNHSELIFYERPDQSGPKLSQFHIFPVENADAMDLILGSSIGRRGVVAKTRHLFMVGQTRVHVDQVEGIGDFMELEVMLDKSQTPEDGAVIAQDLMEKLCISPSNLITKAYVDLLAEKQQQ
uniref:Uncharacterized protein LOC100182215 n=1 Tax=Phallusia mammillata TaxID=59560 RepID=A0A6F9DGX2_9ASCI|nr:uncharacterized protein LOC100182215 [Phallusia mammillata]